CLRPHRSEREHHDRLGFSESRRRGHDPVHGHGEHPQLPDVPTHRASGVAAELELGRQGGHLEHDGRGDDGAGRLLPRRQRGQPPALLPEAARHGGPAAWHAVQHAGRQLLPGRRAVVSRPERPDVRRRVPDGGRRVRPRQGQRRQGAREAVAVRHGRAGVHLQQRDHGGPDQDQGRQEPLRPGAPDMAGDLLVLAVPGVGGAVVLRLHDDLLQRDDRRLPAVQLRLPRVPTVATMRQRRSTTTMVAGRRRRRAVVGADRLVLRAHVPDPGALAREDELPQVLAGEGDGVQLQPGEELQRLEPGAAAPQPAEPDAAVQLQLQASRRVRRL
ncbi:hypothetical protein ACJX0J_011488, partial [Zea mays]